jgi:hypothetical protein
MITIELVGAESLHLAKSYHFEVMPAQRVEDHLKAHILLGRSLPNGSVSQQDDRQQGRTKTIAIASSIPSTSRSASTNPKLSFGKNQDVRPKERTQVKSQKLPKVISTVVSETCVICLCEIIEPETLPCKHTFCKHCINHMFKNHQPKCPLCGVMHGASKGDQPAGDMSVRQTTNTLPGYEKYGTIEISYNFPSGTQGVSRIFMQTVV